MQASREGSGAERAEELSGDSAAQCTSLAGAPTQAHPTGVHVSAVPARVGHGRGDISKRGWSGLAAQGTGTKTLRSVTRARFPRSSIPDRQTDRHTDMGLAVAPGSCR